MTRFTRLVSYDVTDQVLSIITEHIDRRIVDFGERFQDLSVMDFPICRTRYSLADVDLVENEFKDELADLRNHESVSAIHSVQRQLMWVHPENVEK